MSLRGGSENRRSNLQNVIRLPRRFAPRNDVTRVGIFGGTFNPIHNGHIKMAEAARKEYKLDVVYFIPCGIPPHRTKDLYSAKLRYKLVFEAIKNKKCFKVLDIEIEKKKPAYTVNTIMSLRGVTLLRRSNLKTLGDCRVGAKAPPRNDVKLFFLIGADEFENLKKWKYPEKLAKMVIFLVLPRPEEKIKAPKIKNLKWHMVYTKPVNISSTEIRKHLKEGISVKKLVPPGAFKALIKSFKSPF